MTEPKPKPTSGLVVSSVTGKPMQRPQAPTGVVPKRATSDQGNDSNDDRLTRDVPPHWGR